jgi:Glycerophosphoryl diester phosphodiesterase
MKVVAHRGYSGKYPENTMLAFEMAAKAEADEIELDVQLSRDGEVIVCHDESLDRTTDGSGLLQNYTLKELKSFNAAKLFPQFGKVEIPSFDEYCAWAAGQKLTTNIEIKTGIIYYKEIEKKTIAILEKYNLTERVMFSSFNHMSLVETKKIAPSIPVGALVDHRGVGNPGYYCSKFGFEFYHPGYKGLTDEMISDLKAHKVGVNVWTVNDMDTLEKLHEWDVSGVITNYPAVCRNYLKGIAK